MTGFKDGTMYAARYYIYNPMEMWHPVSVCPDERLAVEDGRRDGPPQATEGCLWGQVLEVPVRFHLCIHK